MASETGRLEWLEAKAPTLFLAGGALYAVLVVNRILSTYTGTSFTMASTFAWAGWVLIPLGLLGLYPALVGRRPYLSRAAAVVAVIPAVCSAIVTAGELIKAAGILSEAPGPLGLAPFVAMITFSLAMALFGITALLADAHPKALGVLMLVSASIFPLWMTVLSALPAFVGNGAELATYLAVGVVLLNTGVPTDGTDPAAEPTA